MARTFQMMVTFVSQCQKNALKKTRRVLDAFADRIGDNTWQTVITEDGLLTVKKMLRQTASKNTAVSCHWIRSRSRSHFLWVVGNKRKFDSEGRVPVNSTRRELFSEDFKSNWYTVEDIKLLSQMAALLHDLGKASVAFQNRLRGKLTEKNIYRHEWVSLRLFLAFVGGDNDEQWLERMISPEKGDLDSWTRPGRYFRDGIDENVSPPFKNLPPLVSAVAWLVVTHHRLPMKPSCENGRKKCQVKINNEGVKANKIPYLLETINSDWNELARDAELEEIEPYWSFNKKSPFDYPRWQKRLGKIAEKLMQLKNGQGKGDWLNNPYVMHLSRLSLMLGDHHYSSLPPESKARAKGDKGDKLYANTDKDGSLKQSLTEHLLGVARLSGSVAHNLPLIEKELPKLADHKGLQRKSGSGRFKWQDKAADAAQNIRELSKMHGAFIINMASTGCGKTIANARILYNLSDPEDGMRACFALGLRTLTLQTGRSYREDLNLDEDELAIRVGGSASKALFEYYEQKAEETGSASTQELMEEDGYVVYEGLLEEHPVFSQVLSDPKIHRLLVAPVLVCTIDHLMPATEAQRAGRQIAPMLRLMSSDIVLDELDDFDINDLPALTRLVYWAGLLGSRIVISSATLPPSLVEGMYQSYLSGRKIYDSNRNLDSSTSLSIPCIWVDEFNVKTEHCQNVEQFKQSHRQFVSGRTKCLDKSIKKEGAKRRGVLLPIDIQATKREEVAQEFAPVAKNAILKAHQNHQEICSRTGKSVSFGLVRMANIEPLIKTARALFAMDAPDDTRFHICVYHSRFPLLLRSAIEYQLDTVLNRRNPVAVYDQKNIREAIDQFPEKNHIFVVLGSPVTEVGRDHDYDWAVVEPSSMRSLIQLAGRVQRHRQKSCTTPNIYIFEKNLRHFYRDLGGDKKPNAVFIKPGFEIENANVGAPFRLNSHNLNKLLRQEDYEIISAKPRIDPQEPLGDSRKSLVDLEHARLAASVLPQAMSGAPVGRGVKPEGQDINAASNWLFPQSSLTWALPQFQPFRYSPAREETLVFLPDEDDEGLLVHRIHEEGGKGKPSVYTLEEYRVERFELKLGRGMSIWGQHNLMDLLVELVDAEGLPLKVCAEQFTAVSVPDSRNGWLFHPALGFAKKK